LVGEETRNSATTGTVQRHRVRQSHSSQVQNPNFTGPENKPNPGPNLQNFVK